MRSLRAPLANVLWYIIWLVLVIACQRWEQLCISQTGLHTFMAASFLLVSILVLLIMSGRYHHEQKFFITFEDTWRNGVNSFFNIILLAILVLGCFMVLVSYLKTKSFFPSLTNPTDYLAYGQAAFWFDLLTSSLIIAIEQQYVCVGFFFNYFFLKNNLMSALGGIFLSGLVFGLLNMENLHFINLFVYCAIGWLLATVYLATQNFSLNLMLGVFVALMKVILI